MVVLMLAACGGGLSPDDYNAAYQSAYCDYAVRCRESSEKADCLATFPNRPTPIDSFQLAGLHAGTIQWNTDAARACIDAVRETSCRRDDVPAPVCAGVMTGTVAVGGACDPNISEMCDGGFCGEAGDASCTVDACCAGTCRALPTPQPIGASCMVAPCVEEAYCAPMAVCAPRLGVGEDCSANIGGCVAGTDCNDRGGAETCTVLPDTGETCYGDLPCGNLSDECQANVCAPRPVAGDACDPRYGCVGDSTCRDGLCVHVIPPAPGAPCDTDDECAYPQLCASGYCARDLADGAACIRGIECESTFCDATSRQCVTPACYQ
ncbi:MAG TPA: hypothetical protein VGM88_33585 [Kofleriaceae bacterium]